MDVLDVTALRTLGRHLKRWLWSRACFTTKANEGACGHPSCGTGDPRLRHPVAPSLSPFSFPPGRRLGFTIDNGKLHNVSLGQGQEVVAEDALDMAAEKGHWVILQVRGSRTRGPCRSPPQTGRRRRRLRVQPCLGCRGCSGDGVGSSVGTETQGFVLRAPDASGKVPLLPPADGGEASASLFGWTPAGPLSWVQPPPSPSSIRLSRSPSRPPGSLRAANFNPGGPRLVPSPSPKPPSGGLGPPDLSRCWQRVGRARLRMAGVLD